MTPDPSLRLLDTSLRLLDAAETAARLPYAALLDALASAAQELAAGHIACPPRLVVGMAGGAVLLSMPAVAADVVVHKLVTVVPGNAARGLPAIQGQLSVLDATSGRTLLLLDGPTVTGRRTAAVSMLAVRAAAASPPRQVLLIGAGVQARHHVDALLALHPQAAIRVRGRSPGSAARLCAAYPGRELAPEEQGAAAVPDLVIACTGSHAPVYAEPARADRLLIGVGAFKPDMAEFDAATVQASAVFVDDPVGARHEAGDLLQAGVDWAAVKSLAELLRQGPPAGRPLLFKSVGCAAWDLAAARVALGAG